MQTEKHDKVTLYTERATGGIATYSIWHDGYGTIWIEANGSRYQEKVTKGLAGRSLADQVALRMNSRIQKKLDSGFKRSIDEISGFKTNKLGLAMPMLAKPYEKVNKIQEKYDGQAIVQMKYDGHRCLSTVVNGEVVMYSRQGKIIDTLPEIKDTIRKMGLQEGEYLDGELYVHGMPLQKISSLVKKRQKESQWIMYIVYDIFTTEDEMVRNYANVPRSYGRDSTNGIRLTVLKNLFANLRVFFPLAPGVILAQSINRSITDEPGLIEYHNLATERGYEGLILRNEAGIYVPGKRSDDLSKVKRRQDAEFEIVGIEGNRDGWAIMTVRNDTNGATFDVLAPGSVSEKKKITKQKENYIGKMVTCAFPGRTVDDIPFHCVAIRIREDV